MKRRLIRNGYCLFIIIGIILLISTNISSKINVPVENMEESNSKTNVPVENLEESNSICSVLGINGDKWLSQLENREKTDFYLGTPYSTDYSYARSPNGDKHENNYSAMNCTGFVWYTFVDAGANPSDVPYIKNAEDSTGERWPDFIDNNHITSYTFDKKDEMLVSDLLEKGDIIWMWNNETGRENGDSIHHMGIFWGRTSSEDLMWHSDPKGNRISKIEPLASSCTYEIVKTCSSTETSLISYQTPLQ